MVRLTCAYAKVTSSWVSRVSAGLPHDLEPERFYPEGATPSSLAASWIENVKVHTVQARGHSPEPAFGEQAREVSSVQVRDVSLRPQSEQAIFL